MKVGQRIVPERELDEARAVRHNGATDAEFEAAGIMNPGPRSSRLQSRMVYDCPSPSHPPPTPPTQPAGYCTCGCVTAASASGEAKWAVWG